MTARVLTPDGAYHAKTRIDWVILPEGSYDDIAPVEKSVQGTGWPAATFPATTTAGGLQVERLTPEAIEKHFRFPRGRYEHTLLQEPPLDSVFQWHAVHGEVVNPQRPDAATAGEWSVVEDARFVLPLALVPAACPAKMTLSHDSLSQLLHVTDTGKLPNSDHRMRPRLAPTRLDPVADSDVLSVTHLTHDLRLPHPANAGRVWRTRGRALPPPGH
jgi:hypothetical protein